MKTVCIIQARLGSTRFPGKVLEPILNVGKPNGITSIELIYNAVSRVKAIEEVVIACPEKDYDVFSRFAMDQWEYTGKKFYVFGGPEENVYERTLQAAQYRNAEVIVDITSDCPFISAYELQRMLNAFYDGYTGGLDYVSNVFPERRVPDGMDTQIYSTQGMMKCFESILQPQHSGWNIFERLGSQWIIPYPRISARQEKYAGFRITLDTPEDLAVLRKLAPLYMELGCLDTRKKLNQFLIHLWEQPPEFWDNRDIRAKIAGEG